MSAQVRESAAEWLDRQRKAIDANGPVTLTLGFADADRLATILCRIESGLNFETYDDEEEAEKDRDAVCRLFTVVCHATDAASKAVTE
jgi:hypothetical protein